METRKEKEKAKYFHIENLRTHVVLKLLTFVMQDKNVNKNLDLMLKVAN